MLETLTHDNFLLYCAKFYQNPQCHDVKEFLEDIKRIKYIKKLFTRYEKTDDLKERLILNHIIVLNNMFGPQHVVKILFLKIDVNHWSYLKPFLVFLNILPLRIMGLEKPILTDDIPLDPKIIETLRSI